MRAVSESPDLAYVTGIDEDRVIRATWIIGGVCATAAGVFLALDIAGSLRHRVGLGMKI